MYLTSISSSRGSYITSLKHSKIAPPEIIYVSGKESGFFNGDYPEQRSHFSIGQTRFNNVGILDRRIATVLSGKHIKFIAKVKTR